MPYSMRCISAIDSATRLGFWAVEKTAAAPLAKALKFGYNITHDACVQPYLKTIHTGYAKVCDGLGFPVKLATGTWFGETSWNWAAKKRFTKGLRNTISWPIKKCIRKYGLVPLVRKHLLGYYVEKQIKKTTAYQITKWFGKSDDIDHQMKKHIDGIAYQIVDAIEDKYLEGLSKKITHLVCMGLMGVAASYVWARIMSAFLGEDEASFYMDVVRWTNALGPKAIQMLLAQTHSLLPAFIANLPGIKPVIEEMHQKKAIDTLVDQMKHILFKTGFTLNTLVPTGTPEEINNILTEISLYLLSNTFIKQKSGAI